MRSNMELLELLKEDFTQESKDRIKQGHPTLGLCFSVMKLYLVISSKERYILDKLIVRTNVPESMKNSCHWLGENYWWATNKEGMKQRLLFLDYLISKELGVWGRIKQMLKKLF